jgi:hypothetical protein
MIILLFLFACAEQRCADACGKQGYTYTSEYRGVGPMIPASCICGAPPVEKTP